MFGAKKKITFMTKKFKAAHTSVGISNNFPILFFFPKRIYTTWEDHGNKYQRSKKRWPSPGAKNN